MKILVFTDVHLGNKLVDVIDPLTQIENVFDTIKIDVVFDLGDTFDYFNVSPVYRHRLAKLHKKIIDNGASLYMLAGNHTANEEFNYVFPYATFVNKPTILDVKGLKVGFLPHVRRDLNNYDFILKEKDLDFILGHGTILGQNLIQGFIPVDNGLTFDLASLYSQDCFILFGHYHKRSSLFFDKFYRGYIGSLTYTSFAEVDDEKGFMIIDYKSKNDFSYKFYNELPYKLKKIHVIWDKEIGDFLYGINENDLVKLIIEYDEHDYDKINFKYIDKMLSLAKYSVIEKRPIPHNKIVRVQSLKKEMPLQNELVLYWEYLGYSPELIEQLKFYSPYLEMENGDVALLNKIAEGVTDEIA